MSTLPPRHTGPFEVRAVVYGGLIGRLIDTHSTVEAAEAAHCDVDPEQILVVLGPAPSADPGQKVVCSERDSSGRWRRPDFGRPPSA